MILLSVYPYDGVERFNNMPFLAENIMSDKENKENENKEEAIATPKPPPSISRDWGSGFGSGRSKLFENPEDFDIYCDRERGVNYIFHGPELGCTIDYLEYDPDTQRITVHTNDHQRLDLGAKIQWLVRPYIAKDQYLFIIRTKDGKAIDGVEVKLKVKEPEIQKTLN